MSGILIDVNARTSKSEQDLARINESLRNIEKSTNSASKALSNAFVGLGTALVSGAALTSLKNISSEFTNLENKIALVTGRTEQLVVVQSKLFKIAEETRGSLAGTVSTFSSFGRSLKEAGASTENILKATKAVQQSLAISGSSAESAAAALVQLGQGLSSGVLRGEELNSVLEQTPRLAQAIADELQVNLGQLRRLGAEGQIVSDVVFKALLNQAQKINKEFEVLTPTFQQASNALSDAVKIYISELDKGLGLSAALGKSTFNIAKYIKEASNNAYELGNNLRLSFERTKNVVLSIFVPISKAIFEIGKQFAFGIPGLNLTRTLKGDVREAVRLIDKEFLGNLLTKFNQFKFIDLISVESDVEKAIRKLKRLSPQYWAASGFDVKTFKQVLSVDNIKLYGQAFEELANALKGNTNSFSAWFTNLTRYVDSAFKSMSRYLGLRVDTIVSFSRGQLDTFFVTLAEITRGLTGVRIKFFEFKSLLIDTFQPGIEAFGDAVYDSFKALPAGFVKFVDSVVNGSIKLLKVIGQITKELLFSEFNLNYKEVFDTILDTISSFSDAVLNLLSFDKAFSKLKEFGRNVIEIFRVIYDKVIGNSWWTDTIQNVIDTSNSLWSKTSTGLNKFKNNVINLFKDIFTSKRKINFNFSDKISFDDVFEKIQPDGLLKSISKIKDKSVDIFKNLFETFPAVAKLALTGIAGLIVYSLFPPSIIKTTLIASIISSFATNSTLIAEKFGAALTGGSLAATVGYAIGKAIGFFVSSFIKDLPQILNTIGGFISSLFRGVAEELPVIGNFISFLFSMVSKIGLAGPAGLIGAYLFGKQFKLARFLTEIGPIKDVLDFLNIKVGEDDKKDNKKDGKNKNKKPTGVGRIFEYLFGALGKERTIASMLGALDLLGVFESIFANSPLTQMATRGGILYTILYGEEGVTNIKNSFIKFVVKPIGDLLKKFGQNLKDGGVAKTVYDIIFGDTGTFAERASLVIRPLIDKITSSIVDFAAPKIKTGFDFLTKLLLGKDPKKTISNISSQFKDIFSKLADITKKGSRFLATPIIQRIDAKRYEKWLEKNAQQTPTQPFSIIGGTGVNAAGLSFLGKQLEGAKNAFSTFANDSAKTTEKIAGETGLLGRLFLGKYGKQIIVGSILAIASAFAFANVQAQNDLKSPFDRLVEESKKFDFFAPFRDLSPLTLVILPAILATFLIFKQNILTIFSEIAAGARLKLASVAGAVGADNLAALISGKGTSRRTGKSKAALATVGAGATAGVVAASVSEGITNAVINGVTAALSVSALVASIGPAFIASFLAAAKAAVAAVISFLTAPATLLVGAAVAIAGAAAIWLFGPNKEFFKDLGVAYDKVREFFGLKPREKPSQRGLDLKDEAFLKSRKIESKFSLQSVNLKNVSSADTEKLKKKTQEYTAAIEKARQEEEEKGVISGETRTELKLLDDGLSNFATKLAIKTTKAETSMAGFIESLKKGGSTSRAGDFIRATQQGFADFAFNMALLGDKIDRKLQPTQAGKAAVTARIEQLQSERSTVFNAIYRPLSEAESALLDLAKAADAVTVTNDELENSLLKARQLYEAEADRVRSAQTNIFGGFRQLGPGETANLTIVRADYEALLRQRVAFDRVRKAANAYQADIAKIQQTFKSFNIDVDLSGIFARDETDRKRIKELADQLKILEEQTKDTSDVARQNEIIIRTTEIKRQITEIVERTQVEVSPFRPQITAKKLADEVGVPLSKEIADSLSDASAQALRSALLDYKELSKKMEVTPLPEMTIYDPKDKLARKKLDAQAAIEYATQQADLQRIRNSIETLLRDATRGSRGEIGKLQQSAEGLGVSFENLVTKYGVNRSISLLNNLNDKVRELEEARGSRKDSRFAQLQREIAILKDELNQLPLDFQSALGYLSTGAATITAEDLFNTKGILADSLSLAKIFRNIETRFKLLGTNISQSTLDKIVAEKLAATKQQFELFLKTIANTSGKVTQIVEKLFGGISTTVTVPSDALIDFAIKLEEIRLRIDQLSTTAGTSQEFRFITLLKKQLDNIVKFVKDKLTNTFEASFNKINSSLELNLSLGDFARIPKDLLDSLKTYSDYVQVNLEKIKLDGKTIANESAQIFFDKFDEIARKTSFVKFFTDFSKSFSRIAFEGFAAQFARIKEAIPELKLEKEDFIKLPAGLRQEIAQQASQLNAIKEVIEKFGGSLSQEQIDLLNTLNESNVSEVFSRLRDSIFSNIKNVPKEIQQSLQQTLQLQTEPTTQLINTLGTTNSELNAVNASIQSLIMKLDSEALKRSLGLASGGFVSGPGTGTSDSIPAMLSDGEFVVNARSTSKYKDLLEILNNPNDEEVLAKLEKEFNLKSPKSDLSKLRELVQIPIGGGILEPARINKAYGFRWSKKFAKGGLLSPSKRQFLKVDEIREKSKELINKAKDSIPDLSEQNVEKILNEKGLNPSLNRREMFGPAALRVGIEAATFNTKNKIMGFISGLSSFLGENVLNSGMNFGIEKATDGQFTSIGDYLYYLINEKKKTDLKGNIADELGFVDGGIFDLDRIKKALGLGSSGTATITKPSLDLNNPTTYYGYSSKNLFNPTFENLATPLFTQTDFGKLDDVRKFYNEKLLNKFGPDLERRYLANKLTTADTEAFASLLRRNVYETIDVLDNYLRTTVPSIANEGNSYAARLYGQNAASVLDYINVSSVPAEKPYPFYSGLSVGNKLEPILQIPDINPAKNLISQYHLANHEIGHIISAFRSIDPFLNINDYVKLAELRNLNLDGKRGLAYDMLPLLNLYHDPKKPDVIKDFLKNVQNLKSEDFLKTFNLNEFKGAIPSYSDLFKSSQYFPLARSHLLIEELMASNYATLFNSIPTQSKDMPDILKTALATYKISEIRAAHEQALKAEPTSALTLLKAIPDQAKIVKVGLETTSAAANSFDAPGSNNSIIKSLTNKLPFSKNNATGAFASTVSDPAAELLSNAGKANAINGLDLGKAAAMKASLVKFAGTKAGKVAGVGAGVLGTLGIGDYSSVSGQEDVALGLLGALITRLNPSVLFQLATYMPDAADATLTKNKPEVVALRMWEEEIAKAAETERFKSLYKPQIDTKVLSKRNDIRDLVNYTGYIPERLRTEAEFNKTFGTSQEIIDNMLKLPNFSKAKRKAGGGSIYGAGTGTSDSIPAWLSNGEFVVNAKSTKKYLPLLEKLNSAKGYQLGGISGSSTIAGPGLALTNNADLSGAVAALNKIAGFLTQRQVGGLPEDVRTLVKGRELKLDFDELKFKSLEPAAQEKLKNLVDAAYNAQTKAIKEKSPEAIKAAQRTLAEAEAFIEDNLPKFVNKIKEISTSFTDDIFKTTKDSFKDLLKGKTSFKDFGKTLLDKFTSSIIDTFVEGLFEPFTDKNGLIQTSLKDLGSSIFSAGKDLFTSKPVLADYPDMPAAESKGIFSTFTDSFKSIDFKGMFNNFVDKFKSIDFGEMFNSFVDKFKSIDFKGMFDKFTESFKSIDFKGMFEGLTDAISSIDFGSLFSGIKDAISGIDFGSLFSGITNAISGIDFGSVFEGLSTAIKFLGFAEGGHVKGVGTGTSDSIPAMLSNGEFVINANATKDHLRLLTAINSGSFKKFATGGLVSTAMVATPALADISTATSNGSSQMININITGDISRQTRSQIYEMLPSIAEGVNMHNREKGYKR